jgi:hypothetical protein
MTRYPTSTPTSSSHMRRLSRGPSGRKPQTARFPLAHFYGVGGTKTVIGPAPSDGHEKDTDRDQAQRMRSRARHTAAAASLLAGSRAAIGRTILQQVAIALVVVVTSSCMSHVTSVIQQQRSPDGRFVAYLELLEIEGGVDYTSRVVIAPSSEPFDKEKSGTWIYQANLALSTKSIAWRGNHRVDVVLAGAHNLPLARIETREREGVTAKVIVVD